MGKVKWNAESKDKSHMANINKKKKWVDISYKS